MRGSAYQREHALQSPPDLCSGTQEQQFCGPQGGSILKENYSQVGVADRDGAGPVRVRRSNGQLRRCRTCMFQISDMACMGERRIIADLVAVGLFAVGAERISGCSGVSSDGDARGGEARNAARFSSARRISCW